METKRLEYIDALKGFAIFLVILGHTIILGHNGNFIYSIIYSFHMPLFFIISGFFFKSSLKLKPKDFLLKKSFQLLYPWALWCIIVCIYPCLKFHWLENFNFLLLGALVFNRWFWFLRDLWLCYVIVYFCYKIFKKGYLVAIFSMLFVFIVPFFKAESFYLPVFLFGILLKEIYSWVINHRNKILYISFFVFVFCLFFWKDQYLLVFPSLFSAQSFNYDLSNLLSFQSFHYELSDLYIPLFRCLIGISGSLFFFTLFQKMYRANVFYSYLNKRGQYTLGVYILQTIMIEYMMNYVFFVSFQSINKWIYGLIIAPVISFVALEICTMILSWILKNKLLSQILFGNSYK